MKAKRNLPSHKNGNREKHEEIKVQISTKNCNLLKSDK